MNQQAINARPEGEVFLDTGVRGKEQIKKLGQVSTLALDLFARISCTSSRLTLSMEFFWGAITATAAQKALLIANGVESYIAGFATLDLYARTKGIDVAQNSANLCFVDSGNLHRILTTQALPLSYEVSSKVPRYDAVLNLDPVTVNAANLPMDWYCRARWEPNVPIDDDELKAMLSGCLIE